MGAGRELPLYNSFSQTLRSLSVDHSRRSWGIVAGSLVFLGLWAVFFWLARVPVYAASREARLETTARAAKVASPVAGRLQSIEVALGREVAAGEALFVLDAGVERGLRVEEEARQAGLLNRLDALKEERAAALAALEGARRDAVSASAEAAARVRTARSAARLAREEAARDLQLHRQGLLSESDLRRAEAAAEQRAAEAEAAAGAQERIAAQSAALADDRRGELSRLAGEIATAEAAARAGTSAQERLATEEGWRLLRSPIAGTIAELAPLVPGAVVEPGDVLAVVLPDSKLRMVAAFEPADVFGRIRPGQPASIRFAGFPFLEYGSLAARVDQVSAELRDGLVWVYLTPDFEQGSRIPAQHGLPGEVTVELERVSPATLVLRAVGRRLAGGEGDP